MENTTNNGLMRKTKQQLIDIILRKDDVEKSLREKIDNFEVLKDTNLELNKVIDKNTVEIAELNNVIKEQAKLIEEKEQNIGELESQYDIAASDTAEATELYMKSKRTNIILFVLCVILLIIETVF